MYVEKRTLRRIVMVAVIALMTVTTFASASAKEVIPVRVEHRTNFTRVMFDLPRLLPYQVKKGASNVIVSFSIDGRPVFSQLSTKLVKNMLNIEDKSDGMTVGITTRVPVTVKDYRLQRKVILDIYTAKAGTQKALQPAKKPKKEKPKPKTPAKEDVKAESSKGITSISELKEAIKNYLPETPKEEELQKEPEAPKKEAPSEQTLDMSKLAPAKPGKLEIQNKKLKKEAESYYTTNPSKILISFMDLTKIAVFKRGGLLWVILDSENMTNLPIIKGPLERFILPPKVFNFENGSALAYKLPFELHPIVQKKPLMWEISLIARKPDMPPPVEIKRMVNQFGIIKKVGIPLKDALKVIKFDDPVIGDTIYVVPTSDDKAIVTNRTKTVDFEIIPSYLGLAVRPLRENLEAYTVDNFVFLDTPGSMNLTPQNMGAPVLIDDESSAAQINIDDLRLFDFPRWRQGGLLLLYQNKTKLQNLIAEADTDEDRVSAMMRLARLYFANNYGHEALGVLDLIAQENPDIKSHPDFVAIRGAANAMAGRYKDALRDFSFPAIQNNPEIKLWRGYAAAKTEEWRMAGRTFPRDNRILLRYPDTVAIPFTIYMAESFLHLGYAEEAKKLLSTINPTSGALTTHYRSAIQYLQGEIARQEENLEKAERLWVVVAKGIDRLYHAKASLSLTLLQHKQKKIALEDAIEKLETLRFAWRGDGLEVEILRRLGEFKAKNGMVLSGLQDLEKAIKRADELKLEATYITTQMEEIFQDLFLNRKSNISTLEAISIYRGFQNLMPQNGRQRADINLRYTDYLISVDLLSEAAEIMAKHLRKTNLSNNVKADLGAKLAAIYLLDRQPQKALETLSSTASKNMGVTIAKERLLLQARAYSKTNQSEKAIAALGVLQTKDAKLLKANIYWEEQDWKEAAQTLEALLDEGILTPDESPNIALNVVVAWKLADDTQQLLTAKKKYQDLVDGTEYDTPFSVVTRSGGLSTLKDRQTTLEIAGEVDMFSSFLESYKSLEGHGS